MKIEVGMYVRTKIGIARITDIICGQDVKFDNDKFLEEDEKIHHQNDGISKYDNYFWEKEVTKRPSYNIIDLIEVGDILIDTANSKNEVLLIDNELMVRNTGLIYNNNYYLPIKNIAIKSILTKEQFEREAYKI